MPQTDIFKKVMCVIGTRPEVIKMAPIIKELSLDSWAKTTVVATAQHREMLDEMMAILDIHADIDLNIMRHNQSLSDLTVNLLTNLDNLIRNSHYDIVLAQGDTTTLFATALICFYHNIKFGHIEAGLRTGTLRDPFPEEMNRTLTSQLTTWHFAPTETEQQNLLKDNISIDKIFVTGNTVIDTLLSVVNNLPITAWKQNVRMILVTAHRRENFGQPLAHICDAIWKLAEEFYDIEFVYPVHPNPNVKELVYKKLAGHPRIKLIEPVDYVYFVKLMKQSYLILTDSGGIQEEAPALGKPVLVLRETTERPEVVNIGAAKLIGTNTQNIINQTRTLLTDSASYEAMVKKYSPYGDGQAAKKIVSILKGKLLDDAIVFEQTKKFPEHAMNVELIKLYREQKKISPQDPH